MQFRIDPLLSTDQKKNLEALQVEYKDSTSELIVEFVSESSLHLLRPGPHFKICLLDQNQGLFSVGQNLERSLADAVLDEALDKRQLDVLLRPRLREHQHEKEQSLQAQGLKNLKRFESIAREAASRAGLSSESMLTYAQDLVELEKDLIHADEESKIEKIIRLFAKKHLKNSGIQYFGPGRILHSKTMLILPPLKGEVHGIEMAWEEDDPQTLIQKFFFYNTLAQLFYSQQGSHDPFAEERLWEEALDSIPFPVVLMSASGEVHQHNSLFSKLNFTPADCLKLKLREKTVINSIPYNVYRKDVPHLDEDKTLFVFFTESFFLKGDGNLTPRGQELGIISSSIAHELNNPIAGIQAALSVLMLGDTPNDEVKTTLNEMKNGALRCKQLIETFLGFSRAQPRGAVGTVSLQSPVDICYHQAQNLLRFRTVESGIRFSFEYSKHSDFRAQVNLSLLTMTFYLILGELMTLYSHQMLVANKNQIEKVIKGEIVESSQEIQIQLHELNISGLNLSKLIQNLLTIENFVLQVSDYSLRFIYSPLKEH